MYPRTFVLLQNEGHLIHACLTQGLTALRNARVDAKGNVYVAFFQLSIGLERLMKVCLIMNHMANNRLGLPNSRELRGYGHNLLDLFASLKEVRLEDGARPLDAISEHSIEFEVLEYLSEFAQKTRYFNLNELSADRPTENPLSHWKTVFERILREDVPAADRDRVLATSAARAKALQEMTVVMANDSHGKPMDVFDAIAQPNVDALTAPYAVWRIVSLIRAFIPLVIDVKDRAEAIGHQLQHTHPPVPDMEDFITFAYCDKDACLRMTTWR